jgi:ribokinase
VTERARVCVVGSLHFDVMVAAPYVPRIGETLIGDAWWWKPGGKGGNQAMATARHGADVQMVGCLGDDLFGARLRERLTAAGVGLDHMRTAEQGSGMSVAIQQETGDYAAVVVSGANRDIDARQVQESAQAIRDSHVLVLQNEIGEGADIAAAQVAREAGTTAVLNAAPARALAGLAGLIDILVVNSVEAEMLGADSVDNLDSAASAARALGGLAPTVIVTAGADGVAAVSDGESVALAAHEVERAETHGAGDVFVGALAARLAASQPLTQALRYANAAAALHVGSSEAQRERLGPEPVQRLLSDRGDG